MKSVTSSFWFWLLIVGIFLILLAAIVAGGLKETNGWIWGLFIVGAALAVLGIIFAFISWLTTNNTSCSEIKVEESPGCSGGSRSSGNLGSSGDISYSSPLNKSMSYSPMGSPTKINVNLPQAQRGFATTDKQISSLAL